MEIKNKERYEIDDKYKWDLSLMYKDEKDWLKDFKIVNNETKKINKFKGTLGESADTLLKALQFIDNINRKFKKLASYAMRKSDEDTRDDKGTKLRSMVEALGTKIAEAVSFFDPELLMIEKKKINNFVKQNENLKLYKHYLDNVLRFKKHTLSIEEEKIIASAGEVLAAPIKTYTKLINADIKFGNIEDENGNLVELTNSSYIRFVSSQNRAFRQRVFHKFYNTYKEYKNTFAETLIGDIKANYFISKNKKYSNPLEMALFNDNIDIKVYDNVIKVVNDNLDKLHKYVRLKKEVLDLKEMHMYDFYVDLVKELDIEYSYEDALELIFKALKPLGEDYIKNARKVFAERWVDVFENVGKRAGAYSSFGYDTPSYILLNYNGKLDSVGTTIHELGHTMHTYYSALKQPYIYHGYSIFVAEIASNVNEMLLNMYMLDEAKDNNTKLALINDFLESVKGSIYRQTMFAEFEKIIYEMEGRGETLTESAFSNLYYELNKKYYGNDIVSDEEIRYEWMRIPHFYYRFYVYQYVTGLTAAFFIAKDIYEGKRDMLEKYLIFLSSGSSDYPLELLKQLGIDMTSEEPLKRILKYFDEQMDEFMRIKKEK